MKLIVCLSDDNGMMFNHRRQSRDRALIADMVRHANGSPLWVSPYSASLFDMGCANLHILANPLTAAGTNEYCFVEDTLLPPALDDVSEIIIYRWNRLYPSDVYFLYDMSSFFLKETSDFVGSSHDKITKEIWKK